MTAYGDLPDLALPDLGGRPLCAESHPELWFPKHGERAKPAKDICKRCPVIAPCLKWGLEHREHGVWGGLTEDEREALRWTV